LGRTRWSLSFADEIVVIMGLGGFNEGGFCWKIPSLLWFGFEQRALWVTEFNTIVKIQYNFCLEIIV
jgi:hypothetical protein